MFGGRWLIIFRNFQYCERKRELCKDEKVKKKHQLVIVAAMETKQSTVTTCWFLLSPTANKPKMLRFQGQESLSITKYFAIPRFTSTLSWSCLVYKPLWILCFYFLSWAHEACCYEKAINFTWGNQSNSWYGPETGDVFTAIFLYFL